MTEERIVKLGDEGHIAGEWVKIVEISDDSVVLVCDEDGEENWVDLDEVEEW